MLSNKSVLSVTSTSTPWRQNISISTLIINCTYYRNSHYKIAGVFVIFHCDFCSRLFCVIDDFMVFVFRQVFPAREILSLSDYGHLDLPATSRNKSDGNILFFRTKNTFLLWPPRLSDYHWAVSLSDQQQLKFCFLVWNLLEFSFLFCKFDISSNLSFIEEKFIKVCLKDRIENCFPLQIITELPSEKNCSWLYRLNLTDFLLCPIFYISLKVRLLKVLVAPSRNVDDREKPLKFFSSYYIYSDFDTIYDYIELWLGYTNAKK